MTEDTLKRNKIREMVKYIMPNEDQNDSVAVENYVDCFCDFYNNYYFGERLNWFQRLPLSWRYTYHFIGGIIVSALILLLVKIW